MLWSRSLSALVLVLVSGSAASCATLPYTYGADHDGPVLLEKGESQISRGRPIGWLDALGHYVFSLPSKLILWNRDVDRHSVSPETEAVLREYLADNGLQGVKVRLNEYSPGGEWRRLVKNDSVHWSFRYTVGVLGWLRYTLLPGRLFGGDHYNPFTNTVNIYSDDPAILLHEGGHAKDFARRERKGTYAVVGAIPFVPLFREARATGDAIGYLAEKERRAEQREAYEVTYPAYGTYVSGSIGAFFPLSYLESLGVALAGAIPGHIAGRIAASRVEDAPGAEEARVETAEPPVE